MTHNPHIGSALDELLEEDGILAEVSAIAIKRVLAWQVTQEMSNLGLSKSQMAVQRELAELHSIDCSILTIPLLHSRHWSGLLLFWVSVYR
jgi:hypothetical protein